ncbi:S9 family peptidase [soil metagenome]
MHQNNNLKIILTVFFLLLSVSIIAQKKTLDLSETKTGIPRDIVVQVPVFEKWIDDDHAVLKNGFGKNANFFIVNAKDGSVSQLDKYSDDEEQISVSVSDNDIFLKNGIENIRLTSDDSPEKNPVLSPDMKFIAYSKNNNFYVYDIENKKENQVTVDGRETIYNGYAARLYYEEIFGRPTQYKAFWWSSDSRHICFMRFDETEVPLFPIYNSEGTYGSVDKTRYPKVGAKNPEIKVGIYNVENSKTTWADFNEKDDQYFGMPYWTPKGELWVQWMNRKQNDLIIYQIGLNSGTKKVILEEKQDTWIDLDDEGSRFNFLTGIDRFIYKSDKSGWANLYLYDMNGNLINKITDGNYIVTEIKHIDESNYKIYFEARKENSAMIDLYSVRMDGNDLVNLTGTGFNNNTELSPSAKYFINIYSNSSTPFRTALFDNNGIFLKLISDSKGPVFNEYDLARSEVIRVKSDDGLFDLPAYITWPKNMVKNKKYPVLINIYGGPDAGTVMDSWTLNGERDWYSTEGLIQLSIDHRGSGHFGKEGMNYLYHNLGEWELKDYSTVVKYLINKGFADPKRICISGYSYGGYMTSLALTKGSDVFTHGIAGGSVVDWTLYDTHYTERYMGTPENNPEGYKNSLVLNYADQYKGILLLIHGSEDNNVHFQNTMQLVNKFEDLNKYFELMIYPNVKHGNFGPKFKHYFNERYRFIYKYLLEKPLPEGLLK